MKPFNLRTATRSIRNSRSMIFNAVTFVVATLSILAAVLSGSAAWAQSEVPEGTHFLVELRDKLDSKRVKVGKRFGARTLEALETNDGKVIPAGARLRGFVTYVSKKHMRLRFDEIDTRWGRMPIVANVIGVEGEKGVRQNVSDEGEIKAHGGHKRSAVVGALLGAGVGAVAGDVKGGGKDAAKGAGIGAGAGALLGAAVGGQRLVLNHGTELQLELDRPLLLAR